MPAKLAALGGAGDEGRGRAIAGDAPIGRPHLAAALVEAGEVPDLDRAFEEWLADGRPAWEPKRALDPVDAVVLVRRASGVAVLAHPGLSGERGLSSVLLDELTAAGLAGVEADHSHHEPEVVEHWRRQAAERGLVVTGGSDFHGTRKDVMIGAATTPVEVVEALRERRAVPDPSRHGRATRAGFGHGEAGS
jgi:3',5'-nucleoside bisphosphate phosphatase